jgi:[acyl-carrier-protein] S-malonyltransferase
VKKIGGLFPGQGSQVIGMGVALVERYPQVKSFYEQAQDILGWDLLQICREGTDDKLRQTDVAQPALYVTGYAAFTICQSLGITPTAVAGHSIGEYAALAAANVFSFRDGLVLVQERARLMREAGSTQPGGMMAIIGLEANAVRAICEQVQTQGICSAVNYNTPEQIVIAGVGPALEEAGRLALVHGAKRVIPLNVSGAFHSPLMAQAAQRMRDYLAKITFKKAAIPVVMNADGKAHQLSEEIRPQLELQLDHPVQWVTTIQTLQALGTSTFVEFGAGRVLTGLLRRIDRQLEGYNTDTVETIEQLREALGASQKGTA